MLKDLRKQILNDIRQIKLNNESYNFEILVKRISSYVDLNVAGKKMIEKHLKRYLKACEKDTKLRTQKMVNASIDFVDSKETLNQKLTRKEIQMLTLVDYYDIRNQYGSWASDIYKNMKPKQQKRLLEVLDNIQEMNIPAGEKEFRKRKYLLACSSNNQDKKNKFPK